MVSHSQWITEREKEEGDKIQATKALQMVKISQVIIAHDDDAKMERKKWESDSRCQMAFKGRETDRWENLEEEEVVFSSWIRFEEIF